MAALSEDDLKLILGDKYIEKTEAQKRAATAPGPLKVFLKKIFTR